MIPLAPHIVMVPYCEGRTAEPGKPCIGRRIISSMEPIQKIRPKEADLQGLVLSIWSKPSDGVVGEVVNAIDSAGILPISSKLFDLWRTLQCVCLSLNLAGQVQGEGHSKGLVPEKNSI